MYSSDICSYFFLTWFSRCITTSSYGLFLSSPPSPSPSLSIFRPVFPPFFLQWLTSRLSSPSLPFSYFTGSTSSLTLQFVPRLAPPTPHIAPGNFHILSMFGDVLSYKNKWSKRVADSPLATPLWCWTPSSILTNGVHPIIELSRVSIIGPDVSSSCM